MDFEALHAKTLPSATPFNSSEQVLQSLLTRAQPELFLSQLSFPASLDEECRLPPHG